MNLHGKKILLIEDDQHIYAVIKAMLKPYNTDLILKEEGKSGLKAALNNKYHLILLDIMLPGVDGWEICRHLKNNNIETPIIMLTAKAEESDKVLGLEMGADDYITKPFSPRELIARIKAVMRRFEKTNGKKPTDYLLDFPEINLTIDPRAYNLTIKGKKNNLAPKEFELLTFLARHVGQVFSREELLNKIWGYDNHKETRTIDEHIKRLRKNLSKAGLKNIPLKTVWGVGYKFEIEEEGSKNEA